MYDLPSGTILCTQKARRKTTEKKIKNQKTEKRYIVASSTFRSMKERTAAFMSDVLCLSFAAVSASKQ